MKSRILQVCFLIACCLATYLFTWEFAKGYFDRYYTNLAIEVRSKQLFPVVYCKKTIPANTVITPEYLEFRRVPENILPANAMDSFSDVLGRKSSAAIKKGSAIFIANFEELKQQLPHLNSQRNDPEK